MDGIYFVKMKSIHFLNEISVNFKEADIAIWLVQHILSHVGDCFDLFSDQALYLFPPLSFLLISTLAPCFTIYIIPCLVISPLRKSLCLLSELSIVLSA